MTKPFEPRRTVLFYPEDDIIDEDIYVSAGYLRRIRREEDRKVRQFSKRRYRKHIKMDRKRNPTRYASLDMWSNELLESLLAPSLAECLTVLAADKSDKGYAITVVKPPVFIE